MFLPIIWALGIWQTYEHEQAENQKNEGINGVKFKSRFIPVFKSLPVKELGWRTETNIAFAIGKCGVYQIKENGVLVYIGASKDVYRKAIRHFEPYAAKEGSKQDYHKYLDQNDYTIRITLTNTIQQAYLLEASLIATKQPRDNYIQPSLWFTQTKKTDKILDEYDNIPTMSLDNVPF
jgi:hypothetical protein